MPSAWKNRRTGSSPAGVRTLVLVLGLALGACSPTGPEVVVYTSVDEVFARAVFAAFEKETGTRVKAVYDPEEAKALGLVHRLVAEAGRPQADVFWNGEAARTALLASKGLLEPYRSPSAEGVGAAWRDPAGAWTGFGARARVIVYNTRTVKDPPRTVEALADPRWKGRVAVANPMYGTTAAHVLALCQVQGEEKTLAWIRALDARWVGGNSHVRDLVARGDCDLGLTDTDDVWIGKLRGDPIDLVYPEPTLVVPNTVALVRGAPNPEPARRFIDYLLRPETEALLARGRSRQMPVRDGVPAPEGVPSAVSLRALPVDWARLPSQEPFLARVREALGR